MCLSFDTSPFFMFVQHGYNSESRQMKRGLHETSIIFSLGINAAISVILYGVLMDCNVFTRVHLLLDEYSVLVVTFSKTVVDGYLATFCTSYA